MNATFISKENDVVKFSFEVDAADFEKGLQQAYNKHKKSISIPGFRKGKAPRKIIEAQYGENFFYEDAINFVFPDAYEKAVEELSLDVVSRPTLDIENINKETGIKFIVDVTTKPEVKLGQYKGLQVEKVPVTVNEDSVMDELKRVQEKNARTVSVTDRAAQMGDITTISYDGSVDGVPFDGGKADSHDLTLGSGMFIPGFEDQIVGHTIGEQFDVNVTFPEEYHAPDLSGKAAVFKVELKGISVKELPELDDAFAEDVSEFNTLEEYKADILAKLTKESEEKAKQTQNDKLLDLAVANTEMNVPPIMFENKIDQMMGEFEQNINRQGLSMDMYCKYMGTSVEQMRDNFRGTAEKSVKARLMLEQIAKEENITIPADELDAEIGRYGESYGIDAAKALEMFRPEDKKAIESDMVVHKALEIIENNAIITEA